MLRKTSATKSPLATPLIPSPLFSARFQAAAIARLGHASAGSAGESCRRSMAAADLDEGACANVHSGVTGSAADCALNAQRSLTVKKMTGSSTFEISTKAFPPASAGCAFFEDSSGFWALRGGGGALHGRAGSRHDSRLAASVGASEPYHCEGRRFEIGAGATVLFHRTLTLESELRRMRRNRRINTDPPADPGGRRRRQRSTLPGDGAEDVAQVNPHIASEAVDGISERMKAKSPLSMSAHTRAALLDGELDHISPGIHSALEFGIPLKAPAESKPAAGEGDLGSPGDREFLRGPAGRLRALRVLHWICCNFLEYKLKTPMDARLNIGELRFEEGSNLVSELTRALEVGNRAQDSKSSLWVLPANPFVEARGERTKEADSLRVGIGAVTASSKSNLASRPSRGAWPRQAASSAPPPGPINCIPWGRHGPHRSKGHGRRRRFTRAQMPAEVEARRTSWARSGDTLCVSSTNCSVTLGGPPVRATLSKRSSCPENSRPIENSIGAGDET